MSELSAFQQAHKRAAEELKTLSELAREKRMSEFNEPAYPSKDDFGTAFGMSIRQRFVMAAMQSLLANPEITTYNDISRAFDGWIADNAICVADAVLIRERETRG